MSAVSGLNAKAEKGRSKYVALDINSLYKGKSLENPKATVQPKHGLQSLGKVGTGRRMPPPANLPSLKSENSGNNPNISLVPSGGSGWGSATKEKAKSTTEETNGGQQPSPQSQPASSLSQTTPKTSTTNTVSTSGTNKTWSSVTSSQEDGGQERNFLGQQSPFFPQEFPKLAGGDAPTEGNQKSSADTQYGPGPSLRPQTEGSWGRGTLQQPQQSGSAGSQQQNAGSGVNGPQTSDAQSMPSQHLRDQRPYSTSRSGSGPNSMGVSAPPGPPIGTVPPMAHGPGSMGSQMGPGSAMHPPPQFRGMMPSFMFGRNTYPSGYPSNYTNVPPPPPQQGSRPQYPYSENRRPQPVRPLSEEESYSRPAAIITEKALKGFDEILQNDTQDTWATSHGEIDYNAKLVFSDDEESPVNQKKEKRDGEEKSSKSHSSMKNDKERDRKLERERSIPDRERESRPRESDWSRDGRQEKKGDDTDWNMDRSDSFERERDERWKSWSQPPQGRSPSVGGMDMQRQWQTTQPPPQRPFDYRGPPPQAPAYATSHARMAAGPVPLMQHGSYPPPPRQARPGPRSSSVTDDDEMWRQRRKQHTEEMAMTVERARQRRAEEEKHYEQSKQCAQEKAKNFEKSDKEKDNIDVEENERSRHSSESREDKPLSRDGRDRERERDRSQSNYQVYNFSKQFQKNVPPRFQKQAEYIRQQQTQQSVVVAAPQGSQVHFMRSQSVGQTAGPTPAQHPVSSVSPNAQPPLQMGVNYESGWGPHPSPYVNQMPNISTNVSKGLSRQRSNSQGSGTDSYDESDGCPPENTSYERENYWGRDRRQNISGFDNWHTAGSSDAYYDQKLDCTKLYDERHDFKRSQSQDKEEKPFDFESHPHEIDHREKDFEEPDYRYKGRDTFKDSQKSDSRDKDKGTKSSSWAREYDDRLSDPFEDTHETGREKHIPKDRSERYERERWEKERPPRPDSRDSRTSKDSIKEERLNMERHETQSTQTDRERKPVSNREDKKEKSATLDWGDSPYPVEPKRREWHHHPPPITPKQFESIGPPKKNMTPLRRSNVSNSSQNIPEKKCESTKDETVKKTDVDSSVKKEKEAKEEKNEKIKSETAKESEKHLDNKFEQPHFEKTKSFNKDIKKSDSDSIVDLPKKDISEDKEKHKWSDKLDKDKHEQSRSEQNRDRRRDGRERGGINSRSKGGNSQVVGNQPVSTNVGNRYESSRGRGGSNTRTGSYGGNNVSSGNVNTGSSSYRGKKEYRRSRVERGPRFERQKEREKDKVKDDKKEKHSDDTSCSEVDDGKIGHLRLKDEDSEVSVDEASASTTESAQAEKYQGSDNIHEDDKGFMIEQSNSLKDCSGKSDKYKKDKKDSKVEMKTYDNEKVKDDKGGFAPRGEPSRRGRGGGGTLSFRNSRGGSRHGPSSYGPPPSRAGFGGNKQEKSEEQKIIEENSPESNQSEYKSNVPVVENANAFPKESNKSRSLERPQQRRSGRFTDTLPPRFQKRQDRHFEKFDHTYRGRGRGGRNGGYQGSGHQLLNKMGQGGKENLSDVANEEWETASESSDVAERRDRRDDKEDSRKKESREKGSSSSRKSFSSQRPVNESSQARRGNESRRGGGQNNGDKNRQKDNFPRDTRPRDSGRSRQGNYNPDRRVVNSNGNSRPSSSAGHPSGVSGRNNSRNNPSSKTGAFQPKNEGTAAVYRVDEIKLQDPDGVQAALTDLTNRRTMKTEVAVSKVPKTEKEKSGGLEGYDLNNYASVVIIDDHPEVGDDTNLLCGTDDGFQEVTSKKRHKVMIENEVKKLKKEPHNRNKSGGSRSRQSRLPPRFAKQRENLVKAVSVNNVTPWDISVDLTSKTSNTKDASPAPPPSVNAWEKPITHSLRSHSPVVTSNTPSTSIGNTIVSSCSSVIPTDVQVLASTSKSSSFDRSDQHDSGIDVSDQPASAASSQRSSPSNDCKIITPTSSGKNANSNEASDLVTEIDTCKPMCTVVFENKNFKAENAVLDKFGGQPKNQSLKDVTSTCDALPPVGASLSNKSKDSSAETEEKSHCLPVTFPAKESYGKGEENSEMKLEFTFESGLEQLSDEKGRSSTNSGHLSNKSISISRSMDVSNSATNVGVQSPISPSADDLNLKIQSVKKVWENDPPLPTVMEHPQAVSEENTCPTSYGSFSGSSETTASVYNNADNSSQNRKEAETTEMSFRENSPLQQSNSVLSKNIDHSVTSVKSHIQMAAQHNSMAGPHCAGPLSPPLMGGLEAMTGIRAITGLASSVQVAGIPAIPSPPTVLFNSSQQMAQTGMYQPLQMDSRQTPAAAVAAAMVQFSQSPHGYAPLGTYGLSHQPPPNPQLSNAYGQQSLFVQPPAAHQGQDLYSSSQYRVQPPYPQSQHVSSNQVMSAQQNLNSHLLGSQLVQTRPAAGPSPAAPHFQSLNGLQAVQPTPQTSYFSTSAQPQTANYYHQPPATPGSPMQQQPQYTSHQSYGSQSALNVLPQTAAPNFRNYGSHQYKAPSSVMNNIVPEAASLRSTTRSPTVDVSNNRNMFGVSTAVSTTLSSTPVVAVPPMSSSGVGKIGQTQANALSASRINSGSNKTSQYSLPQSQQHYYPFGQQKFGHVQSSTVRPPQVLFPNVVRNPPHQQLPAVATASNMHYPPPIQRPGPAAAAAAAAVAQAATQPNPKIGIRPQASVLVPGGKLTSAQQAKLRAEAVQQTHMFFAQSKTGKHEENATSLLTQEKASLQSSSVQKLSLPNSSEEEKEKQSSTETSASGDGKESFEGGDVNSVEE